jgi:ABC-type transport system involved in cytochrome c biogenesis permease component
VSRGEQTIHGRSGPPGSPSPTWWVVFSREVTDLWVGGKGLTLVLIYSLLLGLWSYVMASNTELRLIPPKEMVWEMLEASISVGSFICMIAAADCISGDRERATLEGLLLTPTSRRQIVMGKYFAMLSLWPAVLAVTIPYLAVLSQGTDILGPASLWGMLTGTMLVSAITAVGMLISLWSNTLKSSMFATLGVFVLIFMPFALPGHAQTGPMGLLLQLLSPMMATYDFLAKILVNNRALTDHARPVGNLLVWHHLISPAVFSLFTLTVLYGVSPGLRLEASKPGLPRMLRGRALGVLAIACMLGSTSAIQARAQQAPDAATAAAANTRPETSGLLISIDKHHAIVGQGDSIVYHTSVSNHGAEASRPLTLAMNIINLDARGDIVDPEDWSPRRTQYVDGLAPGQEVTLGWRVNAIMDGDYMLYMVVIPKPDRPEATTQPVTSSGIHLTIGPRVKLNPKGILLYVVGTPILLALGMVYLFRRRRRATDWSAE